MRIPAAVAALLVASPAAAFDPIAFFTGPSRGTGTIDQVMKGVRKVHVTSVGTPQRDGTLVLKQRVAIDGEPPRDRIWRLRQTGPGRYAGTLSDATGPVTATTSGGAIRIAYSMKGSLKVDQTLTPLPGGRAVDNRMTIRKWGMKVATLKERIEKR